MARGRVPRHGLLPIEGRPGPYESHACDCAPATQPEGHPAGDSGIRIPTVSAEAGANQGLTQEIADIGHGEHFHAGGSIDQYGQQLASIFQRLGSKRPVELIS